MASGDATFIRYRNITANYRHSIVKLKLEAITIARHVLPMVSVGLPYLEELKLIASHFLHASDLYGYFAYVDMLTTSFGSITFLLTKITTLNSMRSNICLRSSLPWNL